MFSPDLISSDIVLTTQESITAQVKNLLLLLPLHSLTHSHTRRRRRTSPPVGSLPLPCLVCYLLSGRTRTTSLPLCVHSANEEDEEGDGGIGLNGRRKQRAEGGAGGSHLAAKLAARPPSPSPLSDE